MSNNMKNIVGLFIIIALASVSFSSIKYVKNYARNTEPTSFRSFSVSGEGKVVAVPDVAQFSFSVITEGGTDVVKLQNDNSKKINKAILFLKANKIDDKDIKTQGYNINPQYTYFPCRGEGSCPPPQIKGYSVNESVSVKVRDFEMVGKLLSGIVKEGANSVSQMNFTIDDRTELENEARAEAIKKAQDKAESIAKAGGFRLGRLLSIDEGSDNSISYPQFGYGGDMAFAKTQEAFAPSIEPGSQDIFANVVLRYEIQ